MGILPQLQRIAKLVGKKQTFLQHNGIQSDRQTKTKTKIKKI
jgi:hypothetical protein